MATRERPLSPFLIYRPQLTSVLSIVHRISGVALSVAALLLVTWLATLAAGPQPYALALGVLSGPLGIALLVAISAAFFYHFCNGMRHLFWDLGLGLEIETAYATGWTVVAATALLTAAFWLVAIRGGA